MRTRREWLAGLGAIAGLVAARRGLAQSRPGARDLEAMRSRWREFLSPNFEPPAAAKRLALDEAEWRRRLEPLAFAVLREQDTEPAGSSPLNDEHRAGLYVCAGCDLPLFTSEMKYESGTGWPSFFTTIPDVFDTKRDFVWLLPRTEYHCVRCGGHHGHVFDDGPPPTHERWCNNGAALRFVPRDSA